MTTLHPPTAPAPTRAHRPRRPERRHWYRFRAGSELAGQLTLARDPTPWPVRVRNLSLTGASLVVDQHLEPGTTVALRLVHSQRRVEIPAALRIVFTMGRADGNFVVAGSFERRLTAEEMQDLLPTRLQGLEVEPHGDVIVAKFLYYSLLDEEANRTVNQQLAGLVETLGQRSFVLDCSQVAGLTSAMLTQLITFRKKVADAGGQLALCAVTPEVRGLLAVSRLDRVIPIYPTEQDAVQAFRGPDLPRPA